MTEVGNLTVYRLVIVKDYFSGFSLLYGKSQVSEDHLNVYFKMRSKSVETKTVLEVHLILEVTL